MKLTIVNDDNDDDDEDHDEHDRIHDKVDDDVLKPILFLEWKAELSPIFFPDCFLLFIGEVGNAGVNRYFREKKPTKNKNIGRQSCLSSNPSCHNHIHSSWWTPHYLPNAALPYFHSFYFLP